jgi:ribosomal protein S18 acetylase RimI-like enzyme
MRLRPASRQDFPGILRLAANPQELFLAFPAGRYPLDLCQLERLAHSRTDLTVGETGGSIVAFANLYDLQSEQHAFIGNVIVADSCRGQGLGKALMQFMLWRIFHHHRLPEARISVFLHNIPALRLYASLGFLPYGIELRHDPDGQAVALVHMKLPRDRYRAVQPAADAGHP